jgi:hypothetical protein
VTKVDIRYYILYYGLDIVATCSIPLAKYPELRKIADQLATGIEIREVTREEMMKVDEQFICL